MSRTRILPTIVAAMFVVAACSGGTATSAAPPAAAPQSAAPQSAAPQSAAPQSAAPSAAAAACAPSTAAGTVTDKIANFAFDPANLTVKVGDVISWTNDDAVQHTATLKSDASCTTGKLDAGASGGISFSQAGTYDFFCEIHPQQMTGKIEVTS
jgi:plastocyanin